MAAASPPDGPSGCTHRQQPRKPLRSTVSAGGGRAGGRQAGRRVPPRPSAAAALLRSRKAACLALPAGFMDELRAYSMKLHTREQAPKEGHAEASKEKKPVRLEGGVGEGLGGDGARAESVWRCSWHDGGSSIIVLHPQLCSGCPPGRATWTSWWRQRLFMTPLRTSWPRQQCPTVGVRLCAASIGLSGSGAALSVCAL